MDFRIRASYAVDREFDLLGGLLLSDQDQQESVCLFPWLFSRCVAGERIETELNIIEYWP